MNDKKDFSSGPQQTAVTPQASGNKEFLDPLTSTRGGFGGIFETILRRFKILVHLVVILPIYGIGCLIMGTAVAPGFYVFDLIKGLGADMATPLQYLFLGIGLATGYFTYGFSILFLCPILNIFMGGKLKPWRGPYYSLEAIRWYLHNGVTYVVRYTFLEFVTPTPFNLMFYQMMGMKIGKGTAINSTWISDPSLIELGKKVTIGGSAVITGHYGQGGYLVLAKTVIGDGATIGLRATIMGGVTIGANAKVMSNSVVLPKTVIPPGETWGGVPAVKIEKTVQTAT